MINRLPRFMEPDRGIVTDEAVFVYGWIARRDGRRDFVVIEFSRETGMPVWWMTSSAKYSLALHSFCGGKREDHVTCVSARKALEALAEEVTP